MKLLKSIAIAALAFGLTAGAGQASTHLGTLTHDYGIGQYDPSGSDVLGADFVTISDQSSGRFSDAFDFSGFSGTVSALELTLTFSNAGPNCPWGACFAGEDWRVRIQGSNSSASSDDLMPRLYDDQSPQTFVLTSLVDVGAVDVWANSIAAGTLSFWFAEESWYADAFDLDSASLNVFGDAAVVPLPAAASLLLGGLGLLGFIGRRRKS